MKYSERLSYREKREAWGVYVRRTYYISISETVAYKSYMDDGLTFEQFCKLWIESNLY